MVKFKCLFEKQKGRLQGIYSPLGTDVVYSPCKQICRKCQYKISGENKNNPTITCPKRIW